jgi:hypothetical protein
MRTLNIESAATALSATGAQQRFTKVRASCLSTNHRTKLVGIDLVPDFTGEWVIFWADRINKQGRSTGISYEFASNGEVVIQHCNYTIYHDDRNTTWKKRGGISQADLDRFCLLAREILDSNNESKANKKGGAA